MTARRGPGQPRIGRQVKVTLSDAQLAAIDALRVDGEPQAKVIRRLLDKALGIEP